MTKLPVLTVGHQLRSRLRLLLPDGQPLSQPVSGSRHFKATTQQNSAQFQIRLGAVHRIRGPVNGLAAAKRSPTFRASPTRASKTPFPPPPVRVPSEPRSQSYGKFRESALTRP